MPADDGRHEERRSPNKDIPRPGSPDNTEFITNSDALISILTTLTPFRPARPGSFRLQTRSSITAPEKEKETRQPAKNTNIVQIAHVIASAPPSSPPQHKPRRFL
ncbi:Cytochrome P450 monooxygenase andK [Fusarium oxysporum f. sp. albedinis]|nr:Cytochrome P450 monooxygenase andK [Fusarium oxysporum f. sp. albedinis]